MSEIDDALEPDGAPVFQMQHDLRLRDWLAGQAMAGILAHNSSVDNRLLEVFGRPGLNRCDVAAKVAYFMADAMLEARKVKP